MTYFKDKVAIVTGGASGIGEALVKALAEKHAKVIIADVNLAAAETLATALCAKGHSVKALAMDVTNRKDIEQGVSKVVSKYGRLDIMINNAGIVIISEMEDTLDEDWDRLIDINLKGVAYGTQIACVQMRKQGFGQILNTASASGLGPTPLLAAYSSVKHAVVGLTSATRVEAASYGIKVNALCPGVVNTPVIKGSVSRGLVRSKVEEGTPLMLAPEKVARVALKGMEKNKGVIPVGLDSYLPYWANRIAPEAYSYLLQKSMGIIRKRLKA